MKATNLLRVAQAHAYSRHEVLAIITEARDAIEAFDATPRQERLHFIAYLLASDRNRRR